MVDLGKLSVMIWNLYKESWLLLCFLLPLPPLLEFLLLPAIVIDHDHDHCGGRWWGSSEEEHKGWSHLWSQVILSSSPLSATPLLPLLPLWFSELLPLCVEKLFSNTELVELRASSITDLRGGNVSKKYGKIWVALCVNINLMILKMQSGFKKILCIFRNLLAAEPLLRCW